jgi:hypothetical protein
LGAIDAAGGAHVGDDAVKFAVGEQAQGFGAGFGGDDMIAVALQYGAHQGQDGRFIFDE